MPKKILTRDEILAAEDIETQELHVPEWGGVVFVRGLNGAQRTQYEKSCLMKVGKSFEVNTRQLRTKLVAATVVDEKGARLFSDEDVSALDKKSAAAINRVFAVAQKLSGIGDEAIEELERDFAEAQESESASA